MAPRHHILEKNFSANKFSFSLWFSIVHIVEHRVVQKRFRRFVAQRIKSDDENKGSSITVEARACISQEPLYEL